MLSAAGRDKQTAHRYRVSPTFDAGVGGLEVGHEVALARVGVDEVADGHVARRAPAALAVHVRDHVRRTADVVVADDAAAEPHASVRRGRHEHDQAGTTARVERLVQAEVRPRRTCSDVTQ